MKSQLEITIQRQLTHILRHISEIFSLLVPIPRGNCTPIPSNRVWSFFAPIFYLFLSLFFLCFCIFYSFFVHLFHYCLWLAVISVSLAICNTKHITKQFQFTEYMFNCLVALKIVPTYLFFRGDLSLQRCNHRRHLRNRCTISASNPCVAIGL